MLFPMIPLSPCDSKHIVTVNRVFYSWQVTLGELHHVHVSIQTHTWDDPLIIQERGRAKVEKRWRKIFFPRRVRRNLFFFFFFAMPPQMINGRPLTCAGTWVVSTKICTFHCLWSTLTFMEKPRSYRCMERLHKWAIKCNIITHFPFSHKHSTYSLSLSLHK